MTLVPPELPSTYAWGFVVGQVIHAIADTVNDVDRFPEARPATGVVKFEPLQKLRKVATYPPAIVVNETVTAALNDDGELVDENGEVGIWLVAGDYRVSFSVQGASIPAYSITVSDTHTPEAPCDLAVEAPYMPPDGVVVVGPDVYIRRVLLTSNLVVSTAGWPSEIPVTVVFTQDGVGGRTVTYSGEPILVEDSPNAETITAWVWTGTRWWVRSSDTTPPEPPVWVVDTTATTGDPDHEQVIVTFSQPIPAGTLQYRMGSADTWRTITAATSTTVTLTGLSPLTAYAAPDFKVINSAGETAIVTAQAFTTDTIPPGWVTILHDTFTDTDGTLLAAHTPDTGAAWKTPQAPGLTIYGNRLRPSRTADFTGGSRNHGVETNISLASKRIRLTSEFNSGGLYQKFGFGITLNNAPQNAFSINWYVGSTIAFEAYNVTATETSGLTTTAPGSGTAVFELDAAGTSGTLHIDGTLFRSWTFDWQGRNFTNVGFGAGGADVYDGLAVGAMSASWLEAARIEHWQ